MTSAGLKFSFLELQANHAFIRDEMSKVRRLALKSLIAELTLSWERQGRFDAAISKVCFELLMETFGRTIARDLGQRKVEAPKEEKLVC